MLEKKPAQSAAAGPKAKAEAATRVRKKAVTAPSTATVAGKPASAKQRDDVHERIQRRAYELWENEGRPAGREHANWLQAEREIAKSRSQRVGAHQ